jgi:hypothetical protein
MGHGSCLWWLSRHVYLVVLVPSVSVKDRCCRPVLSRELVVLAIYSGKPNTLAIPLCERPTAHCKWRDGESSMYTSYESTWSGTGRWSTVLSSSVGPIHDW